MITEFDARHFLTNALNITPDYFEGDDGAWRNYLMDSDDFERLATALGQLLYQAQVHSIQKGRVQGHEEASKRERRLK